MVDIHSHYLPGVDDGSPSAESSLKMLFCAADQGVTDVICTPHYRGSYKPSGEYIKEKFKEFSEYAQKNGAPVKLWLGQEVFFDDYTEGEVRLAPYITLVGGKYILAEFDPLCETGVYDRVISLISQGYIPIIAHVERLANLSLDYISDVKSLGALIQVNADSFAGKRKKYYKDKIFALFKNGLVDFVASDYHLSRDYVMGKAHKIIEKKYGKDTAERVFVTNGKKILEGR